MVMVNGPNKSAACKIYFATKFSVDWYLYIVGGVLESRSRYLHFICAQIGLNGPNNGGPETYFSVSFVFWHIFFVAVCVSCSDLLNDRQISCDCQHSIWKSHSNKSRKIDLGAVRGVLIVPFLCKRMWLIGVYKSRFNSYNRQTKVIRFAVSRLPNSVLIFVCCCYCYFLISSANPICFGQNVNYAPAAANKSACRRSRYPWNS